MLSGVSSTSLTGSSTTSSRSPVVSWLIASNERIDLEHVAEQVEPQRLVRAGRDRDRPGRRGSRTRPAPSPCRSGHSRSRRDTWSAPRRRRSGPCAAPSPPRRRGLRGGTFCSTAPAEARMMRAGAPGFFGVARRTSVSQPLGDDVGMRRQPVVGQAIPGREDQNLALGREEAQAVLQPLQPLAVARHVQDVLAAGGRGRARPAPSRRRPRAGRPGSSGRSCDAGWRGVRRGVAT